MHAAVVSLASDEEAKRFAKRFKYFKICNRRKSSESITINTILFLWNLLLYAKT